MTDLRYRWQPARPHVYAVGRQGHDVTAVILHSTCGRRGGDLPTLTGQTGRQVSAHWYVCRDGDVYHLVNDADTAYHAGRVQHGKPGNRQSIGIEMEHFDGSEDWPQAQVDAVALIVAFERGKYGAGLPVTSHYDVAAPKGRKVDPVAFPWDRLSAAVAAIDGPVVPVRED